PEQALPARSVTAAFAMEFDAFCDRWGLMSLATWDLPVPQGPLLPQQLPTSSPAVPRHGIHLILPLHYPLLGDDGMQRVILEQQRLQVQELELDPTMAGLPHHKAYAQMFHVIHHERTITGRYGQGSRPKGFIGQIEAALADVLDCGLDQIKKLRKAI